MNPDDHLQHYFSARAGDIAVPRTGTAAIVERARRRRHRRTGLKVAAVVGVLAIGGAVIAQSGDDGQDVASYGNAVVPTGLRWTTVAPEAGLGSSQTSFATTADGTVYGLSTAPGQRSPTSPAEPARLYRSSDGAEWAAADLPDELWTSALAADGDRLYAVGTSPAGGGSERARLAVGGGGGDWTEVDLPFDLEAVGAGFPGGAGISSVRVASAGDASVVTIGVIADLWELPQVKGQDARLAADGVNLVETPDCEGSATTVAPTTPGDATTGSAAADPAGVPVTVPAEEADAAKRAEEAADGSCTEAADEDPAVTRHYSWAELGIAEDAADLVLGRTYAFRIDAEGVARPAGQLPSGASVVDLVAGPDGFWAVGGRVDVTGTTATDEAYFSADGATWATDRPIVLSGYPMAAGLLGGRPTVVTTGDGMEGQLVLDSLTPGGAQPTDLGASLGDLVEDGYLSAAGFGPLGFAGVVTSEDGSTEVVHGSGDGTFSVVPVVGEPEGRYEYPVGVDVSADAITVRLVSTVPGEVPTDGSTNSRLRLFVGTPG